MELGVGVATSAMIAAPSPASTRLRLKSQMSADAILFGRCVWFLVVACIRNSVSSYTLYRAQSLHTRHLIHHLHVQTLCSRSTVGAPPRFPARTSPMVHASRHPRGAWCSATGAAVACGHVLISGEARSGRSVWELSGSACDPRSSSQIRPMCCSTQSHQNGARQRKRQGSVRETTTN